VLSDEELEMLEPLLADGAYTLSQLLRQKLSARDSSIAPMKTFLLNFLGVKERVNLQIEPLWKTYTDAIKRSLAAHVRNFQI
jgi:hypothetical protein